ncbi:hypothetical protein JYU19_02020, partial [bacterium AH-315-J21]|nr:hypothetical protein [bacterium AH-315-J21]
MKLPRISVQLILSATLLLAPYSAWSQGTITPLSGTSTTSETPIDGQFNDPRSALGSTQDEQGVANSTVSIFTGQHNEGFPLVTLSGRGGLQEPLTLSYNCRVKDVVTTQNRNSQTSDVGLGFTLQYAGGFKSIFTKHKSTAYIHDDEYFIVAGNGTVKLREILPNEFIPENGQPWKITRVTEAIAGESLLLVTGFKLHLEDGMVYEFGDLTSDESSWNATGNVLRYGQVICGGVTLGDKVFPDRWNVSKFRDTENLNWINYHYLRETAFLKVSDEAPIQALVNSDNSYVRSAHLDRIETADGKVIELNYEDRLDFQSIFAINSLEFPSTKRLQSIRTLQSDGSVTTRVDFGYDYLNTAKAPKLNKLLLKTITRVTPNQTESLPSLQFSYFEDLSSEDIGKVEFIHFSSGLIKTLTYDDVLDIENFTKLDQVVDSILGFNALADPDKRLYSRASPNLITSTKGIEFTVATHEPARVAHWDSYWTVDSTSMPDSRMSLSTIPFQDDWHVYYSQTATSNYFVIRRWMGGYWDIDSVAEITTHANRSAYFIIPGRDFFVAFPAISNTPGEYDIGNYGALAGSILYRWDGSSWAGLNTGLTSGTIAEVSVGSGKYLLQDDVLLIKTWSLASNANSSIAAIKFDRELDQVIPLEILPGYTNGFPREIAITTDMIAWHSHSAFRVYRYDNSVKQWVEWNSLVPTQPPTFPTDILYISGLASHPNGFSYSFGAKQGLVWAGRQINSTFITADNSSSRVIITGDGTGGIANFYSPLVRISSASTHTMMFTYGHPLLDSNLFVRFAEWDGLKWETDISDLYYSLSSAGEGPSYFGAGPISTTPNNNMFIGQYGSTERLGYLGLSFYEGAGQWVKHDNGNSMFNADRYQTSGTYYLTALQRLLASEPNSFRRLYKYDPFYGSENALTFIDNIGSQGFGAVTGGVLGGPSLTSEAISGNTVSIFATETDSPGDDPSSHAYQIVDRVFQGKAPMRAVSRITMSNGPDDADPIVIDFKYFGGLISQADGTPRFAKTQVSAPHSLLSTEPIAFSEFLMYNDIPDAGFYDNSIYANEDLFYDLSDENVYDLKNGGYLLDGNVYLTCSFTDDGVQKVFARDSSLLFHSVHLTPDSLLGITYTTLDSTKLMQDGVTSVEHHHYDPTSRQERYTRVRTGPDSWRIDSLTFAYQTSTSMKGDNALIFPDKKLVIDSTVTSLTVLIIRDSDYELHGVWNNSTVTSTLDPYGTDTRVITDFTAVEWDSFGNIVTSTDALNVPSTVIYDKDSTNVVAEIANATTANTVFMDFENGEIGNFSPIHVQYADVISSDVFTGDSSYQLMGLANADIWGGFASLPAIAGEWPADSLYISVWAKGDFKSMIYLRELGVEGGEYSQQLVIDPDPNEWRRFDTVLAIGFLDPLQTKDKIEIRPIRFGNDGASVATAENYVLFDDLRVYHPNASFSTSQFDRSTGLISSGAGDDNVPIRFKYDGFQRLVEVRSSDNQLVSASDYYLSRETKLFSEPDVASSIIPCIDNSDAISLFPTALSDSRVIQEDQYIRYKFSATCNPQAPCCEVMFTLTTPQQTVIINKPSSVNDLADSGYVWVQKGDLVTAVITISSGGCFPFANISIGTSCGVYDPNLPNYVKLTNYSSAIDSSQSVSFTDAIGNPIQTRAYQEISGADTTTIVTFREFDARGRISKAYKPYFDVNPGNSVFDFDNSDAISEVNAYYDADGPGPDCLGFPYTENVYEDNILGRISEIKYPGSYRSNPSSFEYGSSSAFIGGFDPMLYSDYFGTDSLFRSIRIDENGSRTVSYTDKLGQLVMIVQDSGVGGINATTLFSYDNNGNPVLTVQPEGLQVINTYNELGWLLTTSSPDFGTVTLAYDDRGQLRFESSAENSSKSFSVGFPEVTKYGQYKYSSYDALGRLSHQGFLIDTSQMIPTNANNSSFPDTVGVAIVYEKFEYGQQENERGKLTVSTSLPEANQAVFPEITHNYIDSFFYDIRGNLLRKIQDIEWLGWGSKEMKEMSAEYDFQGRVTKLNYSNGQLVNYYRNLLGLVTQVDNFDGAATSMKVIFDNWPDGRTRTKSLGSGSTPGQVVDYDYNERGWLHSINGGPLPDPLTTGTNDHYSLQLAYSGGAVTDVGGVTYPAGYFDGNLSKYDLRLSGGTANDMILQSFAYDKLNRLKAHQIAHPSIFPGTVVEYSYDKNGKILRMDERGG